MFYIGLVIGLFVGATLGILILGMCFMAKEADDNVQGKDRG